MKTYGDMVAEVTERGYNFIPSSRIEDFVARAYQTLSARWNWPWLEATEEIKTPVGVPATIVGLRHVLTVQDLTQERPLPNVDRQWLRENVANLEEVGTPVYWYFNGAELRTWPTSQDVIAVRYIKRSPSLEKASDEPLWPEEWRYLIVDQAVVYCLKDSDEYQVARELEGDVKNGLQEMVADQLQRNWQSNRTIVRTAPFGYL
jgi:hypothetical protein